jgi:signal transduction histidine kinase
LDEVAISNIDKLVIPITIPFSAAMFVLVLSLVRHVKNRTFLKHTLIYTVIYKLAKFVRDVYDSGSVAVKTVLIVIGYPVVVALTFFMFPITLGIAAWFAFKRVKSFIAIKEGVERIKDGDIHHSIDVGGKGEFARLAANINSITDGLKKAVDSELKSERLKTELITNVSHDIRTPLTSIITYVDLLKNENDPSKAGEYIEVLDQKSKRLKMLTDDLFEAAKASSGNIPVQLDRIDIVSLITQGLGEVNDKIEDSNLEFRFNHPMDKVYIIADGKLLWRSIENVLSNIFKYALKGSRVYIDIEELGSEILLTFKNISAYELNISADELMERFKRGDESRLSQGSGLGLSIAESLIDIQKGKFTIQVDGDLFKSMIYMPKHKHSNE